MSGYRRGDQLVEIAGQPTRLRLSVAALAEIADVLATESPAALATRLRCASVADWNQILRAVATPRPNAPLAKDELMTLMPILGSVIAKGLTL